MPQQSLPCYPAIRKSSVFKFTASKSSWKKKKKIAVLEQKKGQAVSVIILLLTHKGNQWIYQWFMQFCCQLLRKEMSCIATCFSIAAIKVHRRPQQNQYKTGKSLMNDSKILIFLPKEMSVYLNATVFSSRRLLWFIFEGSAIFELILMDGSPSGSCFLLMLEFPSRELCSNASFQGFRVPSGIAVSAGWGRCLGCFLWSPMELTTEQCWGSWAQKGALMVLLQTLAPRAPFPLVPVLHPFHLAHPHETTNRMEMGISFQTHNQNTANFKIKKIFQPEKFSVLGLCMTSVHLHQPSPCGLRNIQT